MPDWGDYPPRPPQWWPCSQQLFSWPSWDGTQGDGDHGNVSGHTPQPDPPCPRQYPTDTNPDPFVEDIVWALNDGNGIAQATYDSQDCGYPYGSGGPCVDTDWVNQCELAGFSFPYFRPAYPNFTFPPFQNVGDYGWFPQDAAFCTSCAIRNPIVHCYGEYSDGSLDPDFPFWTSGNAYMGAECAACASLDEDPDDYPVGGSTGVDSWVFYRGDCWCYPNGEVCDDGECYCDATQSCVPCTPPPCATERHCHWSPDTCRFVCDPTGCLDYQTYNPETCACEDFCDPDECECNGACVSCDPPPCVVELNCIWNHETCDWECDDPAELCSEGYTWRASECACVVDCPEGECWCNTAHECVNCSPLPPCAEELHCVWNEDTCAYDCDDPDLRCGPGRVWMGEPDCRCSGGSGIDMLRDQHGRLLLFGQDADGKLQVVIHERRDAVQRTVVIDADPDCRFPSFYLTEGVLHGTYLRGQTLFYAVSRSNGETWEVSDYGGTLDGQNSVWHRGRLVVMQWMDGDQWYVSVGAPLGDGTFDMSAPVAIPGTSDGTDAGTIMVDYDGATLVFSYRNTDGDTRKLYNRSLALDATGNWFEY